MIPAALCSQLEHGIADFLRTSFWSSTPGMEGVINRLVATPGGILKGPYISVKLPFVEGGVGEFFPEVPLGFRAHRHQEQAFQPAYVGRDAIRGYWATVTATQSDVELRYGTPVIERRKAAVEWWANLRNGGADVTLAGEFMLTFARGGLCSSLREYWFFAEGRLSPPPGWGK